MSVTLFWEADDATASTYTITKSTDKGVTYSALVSVPYNTASGAPNYEPRTKRFFYLDSAGNPGDVYRITATGSLGTSKPSYIVAPPAAPDVCLIIGYVITALGDTDERVRVRLTAHGTQGELFARNAVGVVAQNANATGIVRSEALAYPDESGMWQVELVRGIFARVEILEMGYSLVFKVPDVDGPINIRDIPPLRGQDLALYAAVTGDRSVLAES